VTDLERALADLAEHLDVPDTSVSADALTRRLAACEPEARRRGKLRTVLTVAAAIAVASAAVIAIAPARHAVAGWLGIGAVEIRRTAGPVVPTVSSTTTRIATSSTGPPTVPMDLGTASKQVQFAIATPRDAAPPLEVAVDHRVPGGLVVLTYSHFTLVEIATDETQPPPLAKMVGGAAVEPVSVHGHAGVWIAAPHLIAFIDRSGHYTSDTVRRSGSALLWERDGVTYRVEGPHTRVEAQTIADSIS
jgi:hypothetical protein